MRPAFEALLWWERRRIIFNLAVLGAGIVSVSTVLVVGSRLVPSGEDVVEPLAVLAGVALYAVLANACYCFGWVTELLWSGGDTSRTAPLRTRVFRAGIYFSVALTVLPAVLLPLLWAIFGLRHASR